MSVREILRWPDARLSEVCARAETVDPVLIDDMLETMYAAPGRGLAAPQIGVMARVFVMDAGWKEGTPTPRVCINPRLEVSDDTCIGEEGCLSVPGVFAPVPRACRVVLHYTDRAGVTQADLLEGAEAVIAQHEADHLDGIMHFDRLPAAERGAFLSRFEALA